MRIKQNEFYRRIAKKCDCPYYMAEKCTKAVFNEIAGILENGDSFTMKEFGRFDTYKTKERTGTDPNTLQRKIWESRRIPKLDAGVSLRRKVQCI